MKRSKLNLIPCALFAFLALGGCSGLLDAERAPEQTWWLEPLAPSADKTFEPGSLLTINVSGVPGLDTDRVLNISSNARLNHFEGARWPDHAPDLLASLLVRSIEASGRYERVEVRHARPTDGCHLDLELRRFFARVDTMGTTNGVVIEWSGMIDCGEGARPVSSTGETALSTNQMPTIVAGFQAALDQATRNILGQI